MDTSKGTINVNLKSRSWSCKLDWWVPDWASVAITINWCIDFWYHRISSLFLGRRKVQERYSVRQTDVYACKTSLHIRGKLLVKLRAWPYVMSGRMRSLRFYLRQGDASK